MIISLIFSCQR